MQSGWGIRSLRRLVVVALAASCLLLLPIRSASASTPPALGEHMSAAQFLAMAARDRSNRPVRGHRLSAQGAIQAASANPAVRNWLKEHPGLRAFAVPSEWRGHPQWAVFWIAGVQYSIIAVLDDSSGHVLRTVSGVKLWRMGNGDPQFTGKSLGKWYVWLPLCLLFMVPFVDPKRPFRLLHFDLLALLGFSASFFFFKRADISASVPLVYPVLAYLFVRMLIAGFRPAQRCERLVPHVSDAWLATGIVALVAGRIALNLADSTVLDIGRAGVAGANLINHGQSLYGGALNRIVGGGDTYGPLNYLAYLPFTEHHLYRHAAQLASISFDLLTLLGLFLVGRRLRRGAGGTTLGLALGFAWVAYPFSTLTLQENTNDSLVAAALVLLLLTLSGPLRRGVGLAIASLTKLFPLMFLPLLATGLGPRRLKSWLVFGAAFVVTLAVCLLPFVGVSGLHTFYRETVGNQLGRTRLFSIWEHSGLRPVQILLEVGVGLLGLTLAFVPRVRREAQVAALMASLIIGLELTLSYWYYPYIVWFAPLVLVALFAAYRTRSEPSDMPTLESTFSGPAAVEEVLVASASGPTTAR